MPSRIVILVAVGPNGIIGSENRLPWRLPKDMRFFRRVTIGHPIIMGRRTFESFGSRPLPKRRNLVVSRNSNYIADGCEVFHSLTQAIRAIPDDQLAFVIGGGEIYRQAMDIADEILITEIKDFNPNLELFPAFSGDTFFPEIDDNNWELARGGKRWLLASSKLPAIPAARLKRAGMYFRFMKYTRKSAHSGNNP